MHKHQVRGGSASEALLWRKEQRWEDKKILFCDIFVLLYCHPTDKRGGNLIGSYEMGHWGGEREGDIRIWIRGWGFMARKGKLRRFWNNHIETSMKVSISLASLRDRPYMFTHSGGLTPLTSLTSGLLSWTLCRSILYHLSPTSLLSTSQEKVLLPVQYSFT